jgi:hypothetical protein
MTTTGTSKSNDFLKKSTDIELVNVKDNKDVIYGTITGIKRSSIQIAKYTEKILSKLIHDEFEKNLMTEEKKSLQIDAKRFKELKEGDRVLVFEDNINYGDSKYIYTTGSNNMYSGIDTSYKDKFTSSASLKGNDYYGKNKHTDSYTPILYQGTILKKGTKNVKDGENLEFIRIQQDNVTTAKDYNNDGKFVDAAGVKRPFQVRKLDETADIDFMMIKIYDKKNKITINVQINEIKRDKNDDIILSYEDKKYKINNIHSSTARAKINEIKEKIKQSNAKMELGKLKYKLRWNYKTNYSGSKYFPLKVSNIKLLSESEKYSQIDRYTDLKEGDIVKYNDSSHKNYGLLAKVVSIGEDTRDARKYYETRKLYTITFEPFESYVPTAELKQYKRKYQNMEKSIANVSASKLLKFRFVEVFYYEKDIFDTVKDTGKKEGEGMDKKKGTATDETQTKLNKLNDFIVKNTVNTLKKNARFIPDYVLGKHQPETKIDLNKLIKPNNKNAYIISHTPSIKKRPNGLFFDYAETTERGVIGYEINIYVDLTLLQSKVITQEEWDNKTLTEKLGNIFLDKIKNSEAGVFNCPNRWDKLKNIMGNITQGIWFSDIESSEPNLIKQSFKKNSEKISVLKDKLTKQEKSKKELEQEIKEAQKSSNIEKLQKSQEDLQTIDKKIKETQIEIIQLESLTSYKGGMKSRYAKKARKTRKKTKPLNKYIKVRPRKTRKGLKLLL